MSSQFLINLIHASDVTDPKASGKEKEVVKKVYATRQKTVISESGSSTDISQKGNNKIEGK